MATATARAIDMVKSTSMNPLRAVSKSLLYKLPPEILNIVYDLVFGRPSSIKISNVATYNVWEKVRDEKAFRFRYCHHERTHADHHCYIFHDGYGCHELETGLFMVSRHVQQEALRYIFRYHEIDLIDLEDLNNLCAAFPHHTYCIRSLTLGQLKVSDKGVTQDRLSMLRNIGRSLPGLTSLTLYLEPIAHIPAGSLHLDIERLLNFFRPLTRLPLQQVTLHFSPMISRHESKLNTAEIIVKRSLPELEIAIEQKLLQDPRLPEEPQAGQCNEHAAAELEEKLEEAAERQIFQQGVVIADPRGKESDALVSKTEQVTAPLTGLWHAHDRLVNAYI